jgi:uncharacterized protein YndB with AHSA1/START domain
MDDTSADARDIVSTRVIDAPAQKIFRAMSQAEHLVRWWGPKDFRNTFEQFDFRPGGDWKFVMHGPDGIDYPNQTVFQQIEPDRLVVIQHVSAPVFTLAMTLSPEGGGKTRLTWRQRFETAQMRDRIAGVCIPANEQNFDRLQAELAQME